MKSHFAAAAACVATLALPTLCAAQFEQFRGKIKEGNYEYKMDMDMGQVPGMPPGMGKQSRTMQHCVTAQDIEKGTMGKGSDRMPENCEVKDFKMSGNTATYRTVCKGNKGGGKGPPMDMTADNKITFIDGGYDMDMKMSMDQGGHPMNMTQHMQGRYIGPCAAGEKK
jgi:hypothetical protein